MEKDDEVDYQNEIEVFISTFQICYCKTTKEVYAYSDSTGLYSSVDEVELCRLVCEYINLYSKQLVWSDYNISLIYKYVKMYAPFCESMGNSNKVVFRNGTFNLKKGKLFKHSPNNLAIERIDADYDPTATCPMFDRLVKDMADGNRNIEKTLYEIAGYVVYGCKRACKLVVLTSVGGSGKSVFLKVLEELVGKKYTSHLSLKEINNPNKAFDRFYLLDSRLNVVQELDDKETLNSIFSANVKKIVSGEEISCEIKFGKRITFIPNISMIIVASNHVPAFESMPSESIMRRFLILNITKTLNHEEQDPDLFQKIKEELAGVFNRALEYYDILKREDFVFASEEDSNEYVNKQILESFPMYSYVKENVVAKPGNRIKNSELRESYKEWADENDVAISLNLSSVTKELERAIRDCHFNFKTGKSNGERYLEGIDLRKSI